MSQDPSDRPRPGAPAPDRGFRVSDARVHDTGRLTIPKRLRDQKGLGNRAVVDLLVARDDTSFWTLDAPIDSAGRVRIPQRKRKLYGLDDGDVVDVDVFPTGMTYPDGE